MTSVPGKMRRSLKYLLGGSFLHHIRDVGSGLVDVPVRVHTAGQPAVITVPDLRRREGWKWSGAPQLSQVLPWVSCQAGGGDRCSGCPGRSTRTPAGPRSCLTRRDSRHRQCRACTRHRSSRAVRSSGPARWSRPGSWGGHSDHSRGKTPGSPPHPQGCRSPSRDTLCRWEPREVSRENNIKFLSTINKSSTVLNDV